MNPFINSGNINTYNKYPCLKGYLDYFKNVDVMKPGSCYCQKSYFRVLNTYSEVPLDVQINEIIMAEHLAMGGLTKYVQFAPGTYHMEIRESVGNRKLIFETSLNIDRNLAYTGVITKDDADPTDLSILMIPEAKENTISGQMTALRMANVAQHSEDLDLVTSDGTVLFSGVNCGDVSNNVGIPSGNYTLELRTKNGKNSVVKVPKIEFSPRMHYTLFIAEKDGDKSNLQILIPEDGVNYLDLC